MWLAAALCAALLPPAQGLALPPTLADVWAHYSGATLQPNGDSTRWADASGNGRHATLSGTVLLRADGTVRAAHARLPPPTLAALSGCALFGAKTLQAPSSPPGALSPLAVSGERGLTQPPGRPCD